MIKNAIFIGAFLCTFIVFGQQENISVDYIVKIDDEKELFTNNTSLRKMFDDARLGVNNLSFSLIITKQGAKFSKNSMLATEDHDTKNASLFAGYSGVIYQYQKSIFQEMMYLQKDILVKEPLKNNWELHNETKIIDSYLCYKATNVNKIDSGSGKVFNHPVIAWYCPELPYSYGPNGYSNLPGLILELQVRNVVYGVKKLNLNSQLNFDLSFLEKVKTISLVDYNKKLQQDAENFSD